MVDNFDLNLVDFGSDYLAVVVVVVVVVDCNNHNLIDLVDKTVDFVVDTVKQQQQRGEDYFVETTTMEPVVVEIALVHIPLPRRSILPKEKTNAETQKVSNVLRMVQYHRNEQSVRFHILQTSLNISEYHT